MYVVVVFGTGCQSKGLAQGPGTLQRGATAWLGI